MANQQPYPLHAMYTSLLSNVFCKLFRQTELTGTAFTYQILPKDRITIDVSITIRTTLCIDTSPFLFQHTPLPQHLPPGTEHGLEISHMALRQIGQSGQKIQAGAQHQHQCALHRRSAFEQHGQVIAVVEKYFTWRVGLQRTTSIMVDTTFGNNTNLPTGTLQTPREVDLLHVGKIVAIETTHLAKELRSATIGCARHPKEVTSVIILSFIAFDRTQDSSTTKGIAQQINIATRSSGILKRFRRCNRAQLRCTCRHIGHFIQATDQGFDPATRSFDIRVQQDVIIRLDLLQGTIVAFGKAIILIESNHLHARKIALQKLQRRIRRAIVSHYDRHFIQPFNRGHNRREVAIQMLLTVPVEYDDFSFRHGVDASNDGVTTSTTRGRDESSALDVAHIVP